MPNAKRENCKQNAKPNFTFDGDITFSGSKVVIYRKQQDKFPLL